MQRPATLIVFAALLACVAAHAMWVCPAPRAPDANLKAYPCGYGLPEDTTTATFTTIAPGLLTVQFVETVAHTGAPYRIALSINGVDKFEQLVLVDHIPHNDPNPEAKYNVHVNIPNINCQGANKCVLQLLQIMTDKLDTPYCNSVTLATPMNCQSVYHSCTDVYITGTQDVNAFMANYTYTPPTPTWAQTQGNQGVWYMGEHGTYDQNFVSGEMKTVYQSNVCGNTIGTQSGTVAAGGAFQSNIACLVPGTNTGATCGVAATPDDIVMTTSTTKGGNGASSLAASGAIVLLALIAAVMML